ncbi:MAG: hypothetical protein ACXAAH_08255 [Promethearchaeota archaeon]|jgi:hypothetical protein
MAFELWVELMILQTIIGYCFAVANEFIGLYNIKDLNLMKGDFSIVKFHKRYGWIEVSIFYALTIQCVYMFYLHVVGSVWSPGVLTHSWIGGFVAFFIVSTKFVIARFKKDEIYKYGQYLGPLGFIGWSLAHWTSLINFYYFVLPNWIPLGINVTFIPISFLWAALIPFIVGASLFLLVLVKRGSMMKEKRRFSFNQLAFVLHGITFGYEKSAKELLGTPAIFKYVVPRTYEFIERMMAMSGFDMAQFKKLSLSDAMKEFMKMAEKIGMAEKIKVEWESEKTFTIESVNCSTSQVRSVMTKEELSNAICPWAIIIASIANKITGKELKMEPSEFNEIGAITRLTLID